MKELTCTHEIDVPIYLVDNRDVISEFVRIKTHVAFSGWDGCFIVTKFELYNISKLYILCKNVGRYEGITEVNVFDIPVGLTSLELYASFDNDRERIKYILRR